MWLCRPAFSQPGQWHHGRAQDSRARGRRFAGGHSGNCTTLPFMLSCSVITGRAFSPEAGLLRLSEVRGSEEQALQNLPAVSTRARV